MPAEEATMANTFLIFAGGPAPSDATLTAVRTLKNIDSVIAADSGLHTAQKLNMHVDVVIGDFDSVDETALARATSEGSQIIRHSKDKNFSDLEAAITYAADHGATKIVIVTGGGGRLDHQLGVIAAMFNPKLIKINVEALWEDTYIYALQGPANCEFETQIGDTLGLQSWGIFAELITTTGLRWPLTAETLSNFETRGISNQSTSEQVSVSLKAGQLLVIHKYSNQ